jgi:phage terminase large subunit
MMLNNNEPDFHSLANEVGASVLHIDIDELSPEELADIKRGHEKQKEEDKGAWATRQEQIKRFKSDKGLVLDAIPEEATVIETGYVPRSFQAELHRKVKRFNVLVCHRRFGKTVFAINELIDQALRNPLHNPHYAYIAPTYGQAKKIAWEYFKEFAGGIPGINFHEGELRMTIDRPEIRREDGTLVKRADKITCWLIGAENPDSLRGMYFDGVILDEYGDMNPIIWSQVVRPALSDRFTESREIENCPTQGWAIFIGTPKGQNHFYERYQYAIKPEASHWYGMIAKASETKLVPHEELMDAKAEMSEDEFNQEYECDFNAALQGAYFSKQMLDVEESNRIGDFPYHPGYPVATFWDLGISDKMAIWFVQKLPTSGRYRVIDYWEEDGKGMDWFIKELNRADYTYSRHHMPHDIEQRELTTGTTRKDTCISKGLNPIDTVPRVPQKSDAIDAARSIIHLCEFNEKTTIQGIRCLKNYQREYDTKNRVFKKTPRHDWASHGADAFQTFARGVKDESSFSCYADYMESLPDTADTGYDEYNYDY